MLVLHRSAGLTPCQNTHLGPLAQRDYNVEQNLLFREQSLKIRQTWAEVIVLEHGIFFHDFVGERKMFFSDSLEHETKKTSNQGNFLTKFGDSEEAKRVLTEKITLISQPVQFFQPSDHGVQVRWFSTPPPPPQGASIISVPTAFLGMKLVHRIWNQMCAGT